MNSTPDFPTTGIEHPLEANLGGDFPSDLMDDMSDTPLENPQGSNTIQIGMSRPPLEIEDLPSPEEAFKVKRIGVEELILLVLGPGLIALGISIGSGAWLYGPLNYSTYGFRGLFWVLLVSTVLQVFYNVELARFTVATGEPPILAFGRTPPGYTIWIPLALIGLFLAFILGGWTVEAGSSLFTLVTGRLYNPDELGTVRWIGIGLMLSIFVVITIGRKIERSMEAIQGIFLSFILVGLVSVALVVVPLKFWGESLVSLVIPARPPAGTDLTLLGTLVGFSALAAGFNFMFIGYYRDKGYGMGFRTGYLASWLSRERRALSPTGKTFPENERNTALWNRWFRYLTIDQWGIYFIGILIGTVIPCILVGYLVSISDGIGPDQTNILNYTSLQLSQRYGPLPAGWALLVGFVILYSTVIGILELLTRNITDAVFGVSGRVRELIGDDPRKFYYPMMFLVILVISILIHLSTPGEWITTLANIANLAAIIFPLMILYLNRQLPRPAKITGWSYVVLLANVAFFGFFFANFLVLMLTGDPLMRF